MGMLAKMALTLAGRVPAGNPAQIQACVGVQVRTLPRSLPDLASVGLQCEGIQVTALRHEDRLCAVWGHFPDGSLRGAHPRGSEGVEAWASQLLKDDLNLAVKLPHVQQKGDVVAIVLNDVVVHVDQDSGREEEMRLECSRSLVFRASGW